MDKGPKRLLHMNQPTMHSINVTNLICNDPTIPRRQKLGRFRNVTRATRTLPCNVIKRAKFSATIPNAHGGRTMRHPTTKSSRRESGTTSQGPSFRTGSSKLTGSMPVNPTKISGSIMKAVKRQVCRQFWINMRLESCRNLQSVLAGCCLILRVLH